MNEDQLPDLDALRAAPVRDLWPALESRARDSIRMRRWRAVGSIAATVCGAAASWIALAWTDSHRAQAPRIERALAPLSLSREIDHIHERPELRLLAALEEDR